VAAELGYRRRKPTVRVADSEPGEELQVNVGRMGMLFDPEAGRRAHGVPDLGGRSFSRPART
jgi:hypothetical protein